MLKLAQTGLFSITKVNEFPSGSDALGVNDQDMPTVALVPGVPEIEGGVLVVAGGGGGGGD